MVNAVDLRPGTIFEDSGDILEVVKSQHHKTAMEEAVVRVKLHNLKTGSMVERTYRPSQKFRSMEVEKRPKTYLYCTHEIYHFMDMTTFEEVTCPKERLGEGFKFLGENMEVEGLYLNGQFFGVELPPNVRLRVVSTVPGIRGDSVSNLMKPATLENGAEIKVPLFIKEGDAIKVDTRTGEYIERMN